MRIDGVSGAKSVCATKEVGVRGEIRSLFECGVVQENWPADLPFDRRDLQRQGTGPAVQLTDCRFRRGRSDVTEVFDTDQSA